MKNLTHIGLLGGTFDPIHLGHLHIALKSMQALELDAIEFIPCHLPAHRSQPIASDEDRKTMIELAIQDRPNMVLNTQELERKGVSYTIDTLKKRVQPNETLYFIIGFDAFLQFHTWHEWQDILSYCHLIVVNRPSYPTNLPGPLAEFYERHQAQELKHCRMHQNGKILMLTLEPCPISATAIREAIANGIFPEEQLPDAVARYITQHKLYAA